MTLMMVVWSFSADQQLAEPAGRIGTGLNRHRQRSHPAGRQGCRSAIRLVRLHLTDRVGCGAGDRGWSFFRFTEPRLDRAVAIHGQQRSLNIATDLSAVGYATAQACDSQGRSRPITLPVVPTSYCRSIGFNSSLPLGFPLRMSM